LAEKVQNKQMREVARTGDSDLDALVGMTQGMVVSVNQGGA
jgi:hypothetical protein